MAAPTMRCTAGIHGIVLWTWADEGIGPYAEIEISRIAVGPDALIGPRPHKPQLIVFATFDKNQMKNDNG